MQFDTLQNYCHTLSRQNDLWTLALFRESVEYISGRIVPGFGCVHAKDYKEITRLYSAALGSADDKEYVTVHSTLCSTNGLGRKTANMLAPRALCVDIDERISPETIKEIRDLYKPDMIVDSSPEKYHLYWRVGADVRLDVWSHYQAGIAWMLGQTWGIETDLELSLPTHMIRVPGFSRVCKTGEVFTPHIVWLIDQPMDRTDRGIRAAWPWIVDAGTSGLATRDARRKELARVVYALRSGTFDTSHARRLRAGRNTCLYTAVREYVYQDHISDERTAIQWAEGFNTAHFDAPLDSAETERTAISAYKHGYSAWQASTARVAVLLPAPRAAKIEKDTQPAISTAERVEAAVTSGNVVNDASTSRVSSVSKPHSAKPPSAKPPSAKDKKDITHSEDIRRTAESLVDLIWQKQPKTSCKILYESLRTGQYDRLLQWLEHWWRKIGARGPAAPLVFIQMENAWGLPVWRQVEVTKDQFLSAFATVVSGVLMRGAASSNAEIKNLIKQMPKYQKIGQAGEWAWRMFQTIKARRRQAEDVIVFQNGVLRLSLDDVERAFKRDVWAPKRFSHALDCTWDDKATARLRRALSGLSSGDPSVVCSMLPVWSRFMEDWFPADYSTWVLLLRWFGYCMTTDYSRQKFLFLHGATGTGKGSICRLFARLLGEHRASLNWSALYGRDGFKFQEAAMHDKLLITIEEVEGTGTEFNRGMSRIKKIVGGERVVIERKYCHPFEDLIVGKLVLQSNDIPVYQDKGGAVRARMIVLGTEHSFRDDPTVLPPEECILNSGEGDLLGMLAALAWMEARKAPRPFDVSGSRAVSIGQEKVADGMDMLSACFKKYLLMRCPRSRVPVAALIELVELYCQQEGLTVPRSIQRDIKEMFVARSADGISEAITRIDGTTYRVWRGVELNRDTVISDFELNLTSANTLQRVLGTKDRRSELFQEFN